MKNPERMMWRPWSFALWMSTKNVYTAWLQKSAGDPWKGKFFCWRTNTRDHFRSQGILIFGLLCLSQSCCSFALKVWGKGLLRRIQAALGRSSWALPFAKRIWLEDWCWDLYLIPWCHTVVWNKKRASLVVLSWLFFYLGFEDLEREPEGDN